MCRAYSSRCRTSVSHSPIGITELHCVAIGTAWDYIKYAAPISVKFDNSYLAIGNKWRLTWVIRLTWFVFWSEARISKNCSAWHPVEMKRTINWRCKRLYHGYLFYQHSILVAVPMEWLEPIGFVLGDRFRPSSTTPNFPSKNSCGSSFMSRTDLNYI